MIHGIYANQPSFKSVTFGQGLNVVVAERKADSDEKKTTNSRGKSTLIAIINFCLGSDAARSGLCIEALRDWHFTLEITLLGSRIRVTRAIDHPAKFFIEGETTNWSIAPEVDQATQRHFFGLDKWKQLLGLALFDLPQTSQLSIRSLLSYFLRSGSDAYSRPLKFFSSQADNIAHVYHAFFIGLNHDYANQWCALDKQSRALNALEQAIKAGVHQTQGALEARKVELETALLKSQQMLAHFKVHETYQDIQTQANQLTIDLHTVTNQNILDRRKLAHYESAIVDETPPDQQQLTAIYQETGMVFPEAVKHTLKEASAFHAQVIKNRAAFLASEIALIKNDIAHRDVTIKTHNDQRAACMEILKTHGALEEYTHLQEELTTIKAKHQQILLQIDEIRDRTTQRKAIKSAKLALDKVATIDYEEKRASWETAIGLFNEAAKALYGVPGELVIDISDKGYRFNVDIPGGRGGGMGKMKIFCYDLMMICMQQILGKNLDFLVHDSIIYEGVDARQVAHAIEQAATKAEKHHFQYIMMINSDMIPYHDFSPGFDMNPYIKLRLSDENASDSLLGLRF